MPENIPARDRMSLNLIACNPGYFSRYPDELDLLTRGMKKFPRDVVDCLLGRRVLDPRAVQYASIMTASIDRVKAYEKKVKKERLEKWRRQRKTQVERPDWC